MSLSGNFENKVVLVTGSNSGIGEATVLLFAKFGAKVVVHGRDIDRVSQVAKKCEEISPKKLKVILILNI
jgi:NADP-dependent 3-hydroxy acid dehydrogenase YdfG